MNRIQKICSAFGKNTYASQKIPNVNNWTGSSNMKLLQQVNFSWVEPTAKSKYNSQFPPGAYLGEDGQQAEGGKCRSLVRFSVDK